MRRGVNRCEQSRLRYIGSRSCCSPATSVHTCVCSHLAVHTSLFTPLCSQSLLLLAAKHADFEQCLLANANAGGENVHRGLVLGALVGAQVGATGIPMALKDGLVHREAIEREVSAFAAAMAGPGPRSEL